MDMDTSEADVDEIRDAAIAHTAAHPAEFLADQLSSTIISAGDPMKMQIYMYVYYSHNGAPSVCAQQGRCRGLMTLDHAPYTD